MNWKKTLCWGVHTNLLSKEKRGKKCVSTNCQLKGIQNSTDDKNIHQTGSEYAEILTRSCDSVFIPYNVCLLIKAPNEFFSSSFVLRFLVVWCCGFAFDSFGVYIRCVAFPFTHTEYYWRVCVSSQVNTRFRNDNDSSKMSEYNTNAVFLLCSQTTHHFVAKWNSTIILMTHIYIRKKAYTNIAHEWIFIFLFEFDFCIDWII